MTTTAVNVGDFKPYNAYWYNQPSDSKYVYIGRWTWPIRISSKWRNPWQLKKGDDMTKRLEAIRWYREKHLPRSGLLDQIDELKDKILGCWCKPLPCHGDVLAELANRLT